MPSAETERLRHLQVELSTTLEAQITELMAHIQASENVARRIRDTDSEIAQHAEVREGLEARLAKTRSVKVKGRTQRELGRLAKSVNELAGVRDELLTTLDRLNTSMRALSGPAQ